MGGPVKIIIWALPRTCSTALLKCLSSLPNAKIFNELYTVAFQLGPDRLDKELITKEPPASLAGQGKGYAFPSAICTYDWVKDTLQQDYPGEEVIISKEIVSSLNHKYDSLPEGYRYVFLLRHPSKLFPSLKKVLYEILPMMGPSNELPASLDEFVLDQLPPHLLRPRETFKEAYDLYQYIKEKQLDVDPVILDADDLVENPEAVISSMCAKLEIPYTESLLNWEKGTDIVDSWTVGVWIKNLIQYTKSFENFRNSTSFRRPELEKQATTKPVEARVTPDIERCVRLSMPFYQKMYEQRLQVGKT